MYMPRHRPPSHPDLVDAIAVETYFVGASFRRHGGAIARLTGQTQARWQVLRVASDGALTVAQIARRLGVSRQNVQRIADALVREGSAHYRDNRDHKGSPHLELTAEGRAALTQLSRGAAGYRDALAAELEGVDLAALLEALRALSAALTRMDVKSDNGAADEEHDGAATPALPREQRDV